MQSFKKTGIKLYEELQSQDTRRSENKKVYKVEKKRQKLMKWLYQKHMYIFRLWRKHIQSFKMIGVKFYEELRSRGTHCLYIEGEKWLSSQCEKSNKNVSYNYIQTTCRSTYHEKKNMQSFKTVGTKL